MSVLGGRSKVSLESLNSDSSLGTTNFFKKIRMYVFETLAEIVDVHYKYLPFVLVVFEILGMFSWILFSIHASFTWIPGSEAFIKYFIVLIHPVEVIPSIGAYTVLFVICGCWIVVLLGLFFYLILSQNFNSVLALSTFIMFRVTRTMLTLPLANVFTSSLMCDYFSGTFIWEKFHEEGYVSTDFPFVIFYIFGGFFYVAIHIVSIIDLLFMLDRLKKVSYYTATSDGRFLILVYVLLQSQDFLDEILGSLGGTMEMVLSFSFFVVFLLLLGLYWRVLPFYNKFFSFVYFTFLTLLCALSLCSGVMQASESFFGFFVFVFVPIAIFGAIPILWVRYKLISKLFSTTRIKYNWLCSSSHDVTLITFLTKKKVGDILKMIKDTRFSKSKAVCYKLSGVLLERHLSVANQIMKHCEGLIAERTFLDTEFYLYYYRKKISEMQYLGKTGMAKVHKLLGRAKKHESKLKLLLKRIFGILLQGRVDMTKFPNLFTSFQFHMEHCERLYARLLKMYPSEKVYRRFARFLEKYKNDPYGASGFFSEANDLESDIATFSESMSESSLSSANIDYVEVMAEKSPTPVIELSELGNTTPSSPPAVTSPQGAKTEVLKKVRSAESVRSRNSNSGLSSADTSTDQLSNISSARKSDYRPGKKKKKKRGSSSDGTEFRELRKKFQSMSHWGKRFVSGFIIGLFVFTLALFVSIFALSMQITGDYSSSTQVLRKVVHAREDVIAIRLYTRKMQVSVLPNTTNPLDFLRNFTYYKLKLAQLCEDVRMKTKSVFLDTGDKRYLEPFSRMYNLTEKKSKKAERSFHVTSLYDAIGMYAERCELISDEPYKDVQAAVMNGDLFPNIESYFFVMNNEQVISEGFDDVLHEISTIEVNDSSIYKIVFYVMPSCLILLIIAALSLYLVLNVDSKKIWRGLLLVPKQLVIEKFRYFGGNAEKSDRGFTSNQMAILNKFLIYSFVVVAIFSGVCVFFLVFVSLLSNKFVERNHNYESLTEVEVHMKSIHSMVTEVMFPESSIHDIGEVMVDLEEVAHHGLEEYHHLRFKEGGLNQHTESSWYVYTEYCVDKHDDHGQNVAAEGEEDDDHYHEVLDTMESHYQEDHINCESLNAQIIMFFDLVEFIIHHLSTENRTQEDLVALRGSVQFKALIMLDDWHGDVDEDTGLMMAKLHKLSEVVDGSIDTHLSIVQNAAIFLFILIMPIVLVLQFFLFNGLAFKINYYLMVAKYILMLFPRKLLLERNVFEFLMGTSSFSNVFNQSKRNITDLVFEVFRKSQFAVVSFNKKLTVSYANEVARDLFMLQSIEFFELSQMFCEEDALKLRDFTKKPLGSNPLKDTMTVLAGDYEIGVNVEVNRHKDMFIAIIENVESSKKKQILELAERRSERADVLLRNILPKELADVMKFDSGDRSKTISCHKEVTAIFADIANFTRWSSSQEPVQMVNSLNMLFSLFDDLAMEHSIEKIKTIGDGYFCVSGLPVYKPKHSHNAMKFCISLLENVAIFNREKEMNFQIRIGMATGSCVAGVIGKCKWAYDVWGSVCNIAARMEKLGMPGRIQISRSTYEHVFDEFDFIERDLQVQGVGIVKGYVYVKEKIKDARVDSFDSSTTPHSDGIPELAPPKIL